MTEEGSTSAVPKVPMPLGNQAVDLPSSDGRERVPYIGRIGRISNLTVAQANKEVKNLYFLSGIRFCTSKDTARLTKKLDFGRKWPFLG